MKWVDIDNTITRLQAASFGDQLDSGAGHAAASNQDIRHARALDILAFADDIARHGPSHAQAVENPVRLVVLGARVGQQARVAAAHKRQQARHRPRRAAAAQIRFKLLRHLRSFSCSRFWLGFVWSLLSGLLSLP